METVKLWFVTTKDVAERLAAMALVQERSRANLLSIIVKAAAFSPDAEAALKKVKAKR